MSMLTGIWTVSEMYLPYLNTYFGSTSEEKILTVVEYNVQLLHLSTRTKINVLK